MIKENHPDNNVGNIDYIRREDALKGQKTGTFANGICLEAKRCVPVDYIESIEPADVVPVCRCKDCKFYTSMRPDIKTGICDLNVHHMGDDGFCSCGERREE